MLPVNIVRFCRALRAAGLPVGPDRTLHALAAVQAVGVSRRDDFYQALGACLLSSPAQRFLFDQVFRVFWRDPELLKRLMAMTSPLVTSAAHRSQQVSRRAAQALSPPGLSQANEQDAQVSEVACETFSAQQVDRHRDFEDMSVAEQAACERLLTKTIFQDAMITSRRFERARAPGRLDMRRMMRAMVSNHDAVLAYKDRQEHPPPVVVLADISGSMAIYSRVFLHFVYALHRHHKRVQIFLFGTRLWHVTPLLRDRDPDQALADISLRVADWDGGTRIGSCLHDFHQQWASRVLGGGATVLLLTDGLDRESASLARDMARLRRMSRRLLWLNPLLRYDGYRPLAWGARIIKAHVDQLLPMYNLDSLHDLTAVLANGGKARR